MEGLIATPVEKICVIGWEDAKEDPVEETLFKQSRLNMWLKQQGYPQITEGNVIHYGFIERFIEELGMNYNIREIAFDRWGAAQMGKQSMKEQLCKLLQFKLVLEF